MTDAVKHSDVTNIKRVIENLSADLHTLCNESKKKHPQIKEAAEIALSKVRNVNSEIQIRPVDATRALSDICGELLVPFAMACECKLPRFVQISLQVIQRLAPNVYLDDSTIATMVACLWNLAVVAELEELKVLQTVALLVSSCSNVCGHNLAKCLVICFRLNFAKDPTVINTASATVRQLVSQVFERARTFDEKIDTPDVGAQTLKISNNDAFDHLPSDLADAAALFQDLCRLVNTENPHWLVGILEMTRTLGLDLIELVLSQNIKLFSERAEFVFLLKESMCLLMIKMFALNSKSILTDLQQSSRGDGLMEAGVDTPYFPITVRLMRLVNLFSHSYSTVLITECEIFLSLLIKYLDWDKLDWQKVLSLEVIQRIARQPSLIATYSAAYDMKSSEAKVVEELFDAFSQFALKSFNQMSSGALGKEELPSGKWDYISGPPTFASHGVVIPLIVLPALNMPKHNFLDLIDRVDPPGVAFGYFFTLVFQVTKAIISSMNYVVSGQNYGKQIVDCVLNACWRSSLSVLSLMLEMSNEKDLTDSLIDLMKSIVSTACGTNHSDMLSACVVYCCRLAMSTDAGNQSALISMKYLQLNQALFTFVFEYGNHFGESWYVVFQAFQKLLVTLNLKLQTINDNDTVSVLSDMSLVGSNALSPSVVTELPSTVRMLSQVGAKTSSYSEACLCHVAGALQKLCAETAFPLNGVTHSKEPYHYAIWQLVELSVLNLGRLQCLWNQIAPIIYQLCNHPKADFRIWGSFAFGRTLRMAASTDGILDNDAIRSLLIQMLVELNSIPYEEVRLKLLDCLVNLLRIKERLIPSDLWPPILSIIGSGVDSSFEQSENSIALAFQALKIIAADFLSQMNAVCLESFMTVNMNFGLRANDLNTSLSAVVNLWTAGDFLYRHRGKEADDSSDEIVSVDALFLHLYKCLSQLCLDVRPPVRKSASQTLYSTITSHGSLLKAVTWRQVFWQILFQLLDQVKKCSSSASKFKADVLSSDGSNILVHHSRDTESKQWAETSVITITGVVKVFNSNAVLLFSLSDADFFSALCALLHFLQSFMLSGNIEVAVGSAKSLQDLLNANQVQQSCQRVRVKRDLLQNCQAITCYIEPFKEHIEKLNRSYEFENCYGVIWLTWLELASLSIVSSYASKQKLTPPGGVDMYNTAFVNCLLCTFISLFPETYRFIRADQVPCFTSVLRAAVAIPIIADPLPLVTCASVEMTQTQEYVLQCIELFFWQAARKVESLRSSLPCLFETLLEFFEFSYRPPEWLMEKKQIGKRQCSSNTVAMVLVPFAEQSLQMLISFYKETAFFVEVIEGDVATVVFRKLSVPLMLKGQCPSNTTWNCCVSAFLLMLRSTLCVCREKPHNKHLLNVWSEVMVCLNNFLFVKESSDKLSGSILNEVQRQEFMECEMVNAIRTEVLPCAKYLPADFVSSLMGLLYRGCIDSQNVAEGDSAFGERKNLELSTACFDTLLMASINQPDLLQQCASSADNYQAPDSQIALDALLKRCQEVIADYPRDERLAAGQPLPEYRSKELLQVFKTVITMVETVGRRGQSTAYGSNVVNRLGHLYPLLVDCIACKRDDVKKALTQCLKVFQVFITPTLEPCDASS